MISPAGNATALDLYLSSSPAHDLHAPEGFKRRVEFESTLGDCSTETFIADMRRTRETFGKQSLKVETYHVIVSQTHEESDPLDMQAGLRQHEMVRAFIAEAFPGHQAKMTTQRDNGRFEDTENGSVWVPGKWHTHVQVASVSEREATLVRIGVDGAETRLHYAAGRAIDGHMKDIYHLRRTNNRVILRELGYDNAAYVEACRRHSAAARDGRPVSHLGENVTRKDYALRADPDGPGYSAHDAVRAKLREARAVANDWNDYTDRLQASGVQTRVTGSSGVSYAWIGADGAEMKSRARGKTGLGSDYTKASVEKQCQINAAERAKGIEPEAPELIMAPPSPPTTTRPRPAPIYLTADGRPPWDLEFEAYTEKVRQVGETHEERARQTRSNAMDQDREKTGTSPAKADELAKAANDARRRKEAKDWAQDNADRTEAEFTATKRALTEKENADPSKGHDLDHERVAEIKSLLAEGGDQAVTKKFGEAALGTPEAAKAKIQRASIRRHERELAERALTDTVPESAKQTAQAEQPTQQPRSPLRQQMIDHERKRQQGRDRGTPSR
ncbi:hypothetical protein [Rhodococcus erythropolis]|uniref:hypothetical protein n=1 Tax=Rhodococcus erythropolis TaxID=1833 RepID=UPI003F663309